MADLYCDHGLYGAASATCNTTNANATITVTAQASGTIGLGAIVTGPNIPADTYVTAYGTGRGVYPGSSVTYTLSKNATATATGSTLTFSYGNISLDPVWGAAEDGDGTTKTASTPATVSIALSAYTAAAAATIVVGGATLTCVASGAGNNQFNAATGTTLIDNIVAAINRTTNTVTVNAAASGWTTPKVQDAVFARRNGNNLEIMTRAGSATYNSNASFKVVTTGFTGGAQIDASFASGVGGAWGYLLNFNTTTNASAIAAGNYGVFGGAAPALLAGKMSAGDVVNVRSGKEVQHHINAGQLVAPAIGTTASPLTVKFDDSTEWADGANPVFRVRVASVTSFSHGYTFNTTAVSHLVAPNDPSTEYYGLVFDGSANTGSGAAFLSQAAYGYVEGVHVKNASGTTQASFSLSSGSGGLFEAANCKFTTQNNIPFINSNSSGAVLCAHLRNIELEQTVLAVANDGVIDSGGSAHGELYIDGLKCTGFVTNSKLLRAVGRLKLVSIREASLGSVTAYGASTWSQQSFSGDVFKHGRGCSISSSRSGRALLIDTQQGFAEWNPLRTYPTLSSQLVEGTYWSMRAIPSTQSNAVSPRLPFRLPPIRKINSLADGARTFTMQFAIKDTLSLTKRTLWFEIEYVDTSSNIVRLSTYDNAGGALTTSTQTWSSESAGQVTYDDGGVMFFNKRQVSIATTADLKTGTEVRITPCLGYVATVMTDAVFFNYDVSIA